MFDTAFPEFTSMRKFGASDRIIADLIADAGLDEATRMAIVARGRDLVRQIRAQAKPSFMEEILLEYGLSSREGVALMCLAEAMLRVPDAATADALIVDKIATGDWASHMRSDRSAMVGASTAGLALASTLLRQSDPGIVGTVKAMARRVSEPVIRAAVRRTMKEMGRQFVLGQTIAQALARARSQENRGYTYSYDMLGEAAMTLADAERYRRDYAAAIAAIAGSCDKGSVRANPGISIKLSALNPRYEVAQRERVLAELVPVVRSLARQARAANMGFNIDAEEQDRLVLSLEVIEAVLADDELAGWDGFGIVVQAYGKRAGLAIDRLYQTATRLDRRIMVRLVKGAYWDTEVKRAQVEGAADFPVFTSKIETDVSYIANASRLLRYADRIYPQFATHNAHTVAAILELAGDTEFEFQRLHGMGESLHDIVLSQSRGRCRVYAPVGAHKDLLAYLVRRLLENGANSSFVNQIADPAVPPETVVTDPFEAVPHVTAPVGLLHPRDLFGTDRRNSAGFDLSDTQTLARIEAGRRVEPGRVASLTVSAPTGEWTDIVNPATGASIGAVLMSDARTVTQAIADARPWDASAAQRADVLRRAADLFEQQSGPIFGLLAEEAGKTLGDAVGELREAVDFLHYYAGQGEQPTASSARGVIAAISPWNFPLAIFTGQIAAALAAGNAVVAKPAERTPAIAALAVQLLHRAGVPASALQLACGAGSVVGTALTSDPRIAGVVFTGSTATARRIAATMAEHLAPGTPLIAETGGLNAMIVDSTALPEQAVRDIVASAFRSAGQRCSALRCLYIQEDVAPHLIEMIKGAMDGLQVGDPLALSTDVGPVIDTAARDGILSYVAANSHRVLHQVPYAGTAGSFVPPTLLQVRGIADLEREIFGPILHVATFAATQLDQIVDAINQRGFGLTFGIHTRIDGRAQQIAEAMQVGNIYVNRNQIGAVVGSQPFGGEGLSGTGPKAGGPHYVSRFRQPNAGNVAASERPSERYELSLPGPTGELNLLSLHPRPPILCLGPGDQADRQADLVERLGGTAIRSAGSLEPEALTGMYGISAAIWWGDDGLARNYARALAQGDGPLRPLVTEVPDIAHVMHERHLCIDTTASGGNAALLAS